MRFDLRRPCPNCPFRKDCQPGWLGEARAEEIAGALLDGNPGATFACHRTVEHDDEGEHVRHEDEQMCAGAMILVDSVGAPNQMLQVAERWGLRDPAQLDPDAVELVLTTREGFVARHAASQRSKRRPASAS
ncbi:MAG: DUF6283 family protein [Solirubrobacterales bacterium]